MEPSDEASGDESSLLDCVVFADGWNERHRALTEAMAGVNSLLPALLPSRVVSLVVEFVLADAPTAYAADYLSVRTITAPPTTTTTSTATTAAATATAARVRYRWQTRFVVLSAVDGLLTWRDLHDPWEEWVDHCPFQLIAGIAPPTDVPAAGGESPTRLAVTLSSNPVPVWFEATSGAIARKWCDALQLALSRWKKQREAIAVSTTRVASPSVVSSVAGSGSPPTFPLRRTQLQDLFLRARYSSPVFDAILATAAAHDQSLSRAETAIWLEMCTYFSTERQVLSYLLANYLSPTAGLFDYDATSYADVSLEESKLEMRQLTLTPTTNSSVPTSAGTISNDAASQVQLAITGGSGSTATVPASPRTPLSPVAIRSPASVTAMPSSPHPAAAGLHMGSANLVYRARMAGLSPLTIAALTRHQQTIDAKQRTAFKHRKQQSSIDSTGSADSGVGVSITGPVVTSTAYHDSQQSGVLKHSLSYIDAPPVNVQAMDDGEPKRVLTILTAPNGSTDYTRFRDAVLAVFDNESAAAASPTVNDPSSVHSLAIRVLWVWLHGTSVHRNRYAACREFTDLLIPRIQRSSVGFTASIRTTLFAILTTRLGAPHITAVNEPPSDSDGFSETKLISSVISFHMTIAHELCWEPLLRALSGADFESRRVALEDISTLLHDSYPTVRSLIRTNQSNGGGDAGGWCAWLLSSLRDIPPNGPTKTQSLIWAYVINILVTVWYECFIETPNWCDVVHHTLQSLIDFAGLTYQSAAIAHTIFLAFLNKLIARKSQFITDTNYSTSMRWHNFTFLTPLIRKFVYQTVWWRDSTVLEQSSSLMFHWLLASNTSERERIRNDVVTDRMAAEAQVLAPTVNRTSNKKFADASTVLDCGLHWDLQNDEPRDRPLIEKLQLLYKSFHLDAYDADSFAASRHGQSQDSIDDERQFLRRCKSEADFWKQSAQFTLVLRSPWNRVLLDVDAAPTHAQFTFWISSVLPPEFSFDSPLAFNPSYSADDNGSSILSILMAYILLPKLSGFVHEFVQSGPEASSLTRQTVLYKLFNLCSNSAVNRLAAQYGAAASAVAAGGGTDTASTASAAPAAVGGAIAMGGRVLTSVITNAGAGPPPSPSPPAAERSLTDGIPESPRAGSPQPNRSASPQPPTPNN